MESQVSYGSGASGTNSRGNMINLSLTDEAFLCDDGKGNGCGRMFDGLIVDQVRGLCAGCAEDLPDEVGC